MSVVNLGDEPLHSHSKSKSSLSASISCTRPPAIFNPFHSYASFNDATSALSSLVKQANTIPICLIVDLASNT